jgi:hypothetical protein
MFFLIAGTVLLLTAVGLLVGASLQKRKVLLLQGTETSSAAELKSLASAVGGEIGPGSFTQLAEVKGTIRCAQPLVAELTKVPCVYYSMQVTREYEETTWETDSDGHKVSRQRRGSEVVAENTRSCPFEVEDATGRVQVEPTGASITAEKVCDRFEPGDPDAVSVSVGGIAVQLPALHAGRRTVGYRYEERVIPLGKPLYVLGEATDSAGQLVIRKPVKRGGNFLVSVKSEEELTHAATSAATWLTAGTVVTALAGTVLLVVGLSR